MFSSYKFFHIIKVLFKWNINLFSEVCTW